MRNKKYGPFLADMLTSARYEVLPTAATEDKVLEHLAPDRTVTVTASPAKGLEATLDARPSGWPGTATTPCRTWPPGWSAGAAELAEICDRLHAAGASARSSCPAGDADPPAGDYPDALDLLEDLTALGSPFAQVGITGYPESHPTISDDLTVQAMWDKRRHATHMVSNLTLRPRGDLEPGCAGCAPAASRMPLLLGMPGPDRPRPSCWRWRPRSGSASRRRFLAKHKGTLRPARRARRLHRRAVPRAVRARRWPARDACVDGLHVFTFNQIAETEAWRRTCSLG